MNYLDIPCSVCSAPFSAQDDVVVCPVCGAPHHRACWKENGCCRFENLHADGFEWVSPLPAAPAGAAPAARTDQQQTLKNGERVLTCPECGENVYEHDIFCLRCGFRLKETDAEKKEEAPAPDPGLPRKFVADRPEDGARERLGNDFYDDLYRYGGVDPEAEVCGVRVKDLAAFIGGQRPGMLIRRLASMERYGRKFSVCLPALLFGPLWYFCRRMVREGLLFTLALLLVNITVTLVALTPTVRSALSEAANEIRTVTEAAAPDGEIDVAALQEDLFEIIAEKMENVTAAEQRRLSAANLLQYLGFALYFAGGVFGLTFYGKKIRRETARLRARYPDDEGYRASLKKYGGVSVGLTVLGAAINLALFMMLVYLPLLLI